MRQGGLRKIDAIVRLSCRRHLPAKRQFIYFRLVPCGMTRHHQKSRRLLHKIDRVVGVFCARVGGALQNPYRVQNPIRVSQYVLHKIDRRVGVFCARVLAYYCGWLNYFWVDSLQRQRHKLKMWLCRDAYQCVLFATQIWLCTIDGLISNVV